MKRIGIVDGGGVLVELTHGDVVRLMEACQALDQLFGEIEVGMPVTVDGHPGRVTSIEGPRVEVTGIRPVKAKAKSVPPSKLRKTTLPPRKCEACEKVFVPWRKDQKFCSKICHYIAPRKTYPKYDAAAAKAKRLADLKALDQRKRGTFRPHDDGVPAELKQAQREARAE